MKIICRYIALIFCLFLLVEHGYAQSKNKGVVSEYLQYKAMADAAFEEADYAKAQKLYNACAKMVEGDDYANKQLKACEDANNLLAQLETAIKSNNDVQLEKALGDIKASNLYKAKNSLFKNKILVVLEKEADQKYKNGDYENAIKAYSRTYQILPVAGLTFKIERANQQNVEKTKKNATAYSDFLKSQKEKNKLTPIIASEDEADDLRKKAEEAFAKGEWDKAQKLYNASLIVGEGKRPEIEQRLVDIANSKRLERQKEEADKQQNYLLSAKTGEEMLKTRPDDVQLKSDIANNYEKQGDKFYNEGRFADARDYYRKANNTEPNNGLDAKIEDAERKIAETRVVNEQRRLNDIKTAVPTGKRNKSPQERQLLGLAVQSGLLTVLPSLSNAFGKIGVSGQGSWQIGGQLIIWPNDAFNVGLGASFQSVRFASTNPEKTNKSEDFKYTMLQIPFTMSYTKALGETGLGLRLQGGFAINKPLSYQYTNYIVNATQTDASTLKTGIGFSLGAGLTKSISKRKAVSALISYDFSPTNLLNTEALDSNAWQRNSINVGMRSVNVSLIFRVF